MIMLYGIKNCGTVKKTRNWLNQQQIDVQFHDFRTDGLNQDQVRQCCDALGWEQLLNRRSASWRGLPDEVKAATDETRGIELMLAQPTLIKRPVLDNNGRILVGFTPSNYQQSVL